MALTAIWRIMIDNGMFSNFPGFLFAKGAGRQNTNQIRVPPGGGFPVDVPPGMDIKAAFMPLPYKETGAAFTQLAAHIEEVGQRLGQTADVNIGEGKQDMPVGTTMALIEQATKIMDSVHKRLHAAQAEEFALLKERFREDPEAFWRHNKKTHQPARKWTEEQFVQALDQRELVPVADPNNPTSLHRIAKATIIDMLVSKYPQDMDKRGSLKRILRIADIDSEGLMTPQTAQAPPDPRMVAIQAKAEAEKLKAEIEKVRVFIQAQTAQANLTDKAQDREFKERLKQFDMYLEQVKAQAQLTINAHETEQETLRAHAEMRVEGMKAATKMQTDAASAAHDVMSGHASHRAGLHQEGMTHQQQLAADREKHQQELAQARERHEQDKAHAREKHEADLEHKRALAAVARKAKPAGAK